MTEIARRCGTHASQVSTYLNLLRLDEETIAKVEAGDMPVTDAIAGVREQRQAQRVQDGTPLRGRRRTWFNGEHRLAAVVRKLCRHWGETQIGGAGCGRCWEAAIVAEAQAAGSVAS